ncbi:MAG: hypothetical protein J0L78_11185 [Planctomycetes bacterium]|nr:hypothetical protein [Planctomycetota bacterium]
MTSLLSPQEDSDTGALLRSAAAACDGAFQRAAAISGTSRSHFFSIGGHRIKLNFASEALAAQLTQALEHVRSEPGDAELEVGIWEGRDSAPPPLPDSWMQARYFPRGRLPGMEHPDLRLVVLPGATSVSLLDLSSNRGWYCAADAAKVAFWESASPLRSLLHAWLSARNVFLLHAAAIGTDNGALLLVGKSGSGKSTTALLGLSAGMSYLGDDFCLAEISRGRPIVHACYSSAKVCNDALPRFRGLHARLGNPDRPPDEKAVFFLNGTHDAQLPQSLPLRAILLPHVAVDQPVRLQPVSPGHALTALSPSTIMQLPDADRRDLAFHAALSKAIPAYRLSLNRDDAAVLAAIKDFLR